MPAAPETYRRAQAALSARATADLRKVWPRLLTMSPDKTAEALALVLAEVTDKYGSASAAIAAEWFEELRDVSGVTGSLTAQAAALPSTERLEVLARWGVGPLFGASPDPVTALHRVSGGLSRQVLGVGRDTLMESIAKDPAGPRYARHASANACAFCAMLATRGAVYLSEDSGGGKYHDDCHCTVVPVWPGQRYEEAPYVETWREAYSDAPSGDTKEILASMREELGTN